MSYVLYRLYELILIFLNHFVHKLDIAYSRLIIEYIKNFWHNKL